MGVLVSIVDDSRFTPEDIAPFAEKLFFEGERRRIHLERFAVLLLLAAMIATYGVLADSTATIIGAMIIAPLMIPIMGTAAGLVMGDMRRAGRSFLKVVAGVAGVIVTSWLIAGYLSTTIISVADNSAIAGRISPSLTDLAIALLSGAAGAFAMSRSDVADTLPGVAISISLVPPLCVVGVGLSESDWDVASGAMLLFLTNLLSILLAGGGVLALLGLSTAATSELRGPARKRAFWSIAAGAFLVAVPLAATSAQVAGETVAEQRAQRLVGEWLEETDLRLTRVEADGHNLLLLINGSGELPDLDGLVADLQADIGMDVELEFRVVASKTVRYPVPDES